MVSVVDNADCSPPPPVMAEGILTNLRRQAPAYFGRAWSHRIPLVRDLPDSCLGLSRAIFGTEALCRPTRAHQPAFSVHCMRQKGAANGSAKY